MNLSKEIRALGGSSLLNCDVAEDLYHGKADRYLVYTFDNEEPEVAGDNEVLIENATVQISYYVPEKYNYNTDNETIKSYLRSNDYYIESLTVMLDEADIVDDKYVRRLLFIVQKAA